MTFKSNMVSGVKMQKEKLLEKNKGHKNTTDPRKDIRKIIYMERVKPTNIARWRNMLVCSKLLSLNEKQKKWKSKSCMKIEKTKKN